MQRVMCMQVHIGSVDAAAWLHAATDALPGLRHLAAPSITQTVAELVDTVLGASVLCSQLSGSFNKTAQFINSLLTSQLHHVQATAYKALIGAACIGPSALRAETHGLLCHSTLVQTLVTTGLAATDSKPFAAQLLQTVALEGGSDQGRACLVPWTVWLACYEHDQVVGGTVAGITNYLQHWRYTHCHCQYSALEQDSCTDSWQALLC